jgi:hypothetical protein
MFNDESVQRMEEADIEIYSNVSPRKPSELDHILAKEKPPDKV